MDDPVERALEMADRWHVPGRPTVESVLAAEVRRLRAENVELRADLAHARSEIAYLNGEEA